MEKNLKNLILSKKFNHDYKKDGFCIHGCGIHRTDWKKNEICNKKLNK